MTVGETYEPQITFTDADEVLYNPDTVYVRVLSPSGALTSPAVTNPSVGVFRTKVPLASIGVWRGWYHGEGPTGSAVIVPFHICAESGL